ncbi:hypothetical protein [Arenimonas sp. MALMAid1274]|uniref:hypothetical protein n=1 Tax=Arenimonas sp. MALMAid1274 TaxID=3411630 RepID=UPI003BA2D7CA
MSWSPQQQAMLGAMGYTLYRTAGPGAAFVAGPAPEATDVAAAEHRAAGAATSVAAPRTAGPGVAGAHDRLMQALVRAAGGRDPGQLPLPPLDQLRSDAAAKRALWPALRALRRRR